MLNSYIYTHKEDIAQFTEPMIQWKYSQNNVELQIVTKARINPDFNAVIDNIPSLLSRETIATFFDIQKLQEEEKSNNLYKGFLATILWGGKHKSRPPEKKHFLEIMAINKAIIVCKLEKVYDMLLEGVENEAKAVEKIKEAYISMCDVESNGINGVKDGYFTKILYFMAKNINLPLLPLIHDSHMKHAHCDLILDEGDQELGYYCLSDKYGLRMRRYADSYIDYCQRMRKNSDAVHVAPDTLENYIFNILKPGLPSSPVYQSVYNRLISCNTNSHNE